MNTTSQLDLAGILNAVYRYKKPLIAIFLVAISLAAYLAMIIPNTYKSSALLVLTPQQVPTALVASTLAGGGRGRGVVNERMQLVIQEILSPPRLKHLVVELEPYLPYAKESPPEQRARSLRSDILLEFQRNYNFLLSFESGNAVNAQYVTSRLASLFIEQNLQIREQQASGTKNFIDSEAERLRKELEAQEAVVNRYKAANLFELPDQLNTNLRTIEQLRREAEVSEQRLSALQARKGSLLTQSVESDVGMNFKVGGAVVAAADGSTPFLQYELKKKELDSLRQRYSNKHPDVIRLSREIQAFEAEPRKTSWSESSESAKTSNLNPLKQVLNTQIKDIDSEIQTVRTQIERLNGEIRVLQSRVDNAPLRAIELAKISRGYDITLRKYQDLLARSLESELAENMEKKQKGEQFQILQPANYPSKPIRPNRVLIVIIGLVAGLGGGVGLALLFDKVLDTSFKSGEEIQDSVSVPLLATLPALMTRGIVVERRRSESILVLASMGALAVGVIFIRVFAPTFFF